MALALPDPTHIDDCQFEHQRKAQESALPTAIRKGKVSLAIATIVNVPATCDLSYSQTQFVRRAVAARFLVGIAD